MRNSLFWEYALCAHKTCKVVSSDKTSWMGFPEELAGLYADRTSIHLTDTHIWNVLLEILEETITDLFSKYPSFVSQGKMHEAI